MIFAQHVQLTKQTDKKQKETKNTQYPEHKENSTWAAKRPH